MQFDDVRRQYRIYLDNGDDLAVHTDGRDWAAMEAKQFGPGAILTSVRFMAYNAAKREHGYKRSWEQFNGIDCVHIDDITPDTDGDEDDQDQEGEKGLDPGPTTSNASGASTSRSPRANRSTGRAGSSTGTTGT